MAFMSKWRQEKRPFLVWSRAMQRFTLEWFAWRSPGIAEDTFNKRAWELAPNLPTYALKMGKKELRCNILDEERGVGLYFEPHDELLKIRTTPSLSGQLIDATMITAALQLTPSRKQIIIAGVVCLLMGIIFGMGMA